jgi:hypothetical protein
MGIKLKKTEGNLMVTKILLVKSSVSAFRSDLRKMVSLSLMLAALLVPQAQVQTTGITARIKLDIKDATMSTNQGDSPPGACIDGITSGWIGSKRNMCHTSYGTAQDKTDPWIQLDLGTSKQVGAVRIYNRVNCCQSRLANHLIYVGDRRYPSGDVRPYDGSVKCFDGTAPATRGPFDEACDGFGRYVTIVLPGSNRILNLAEVQVYAYGEFLLLFILTVIWLCVGLALCFLKHTCFFRLYL